MRCAASSLPDELDLERAAVALGGVAARGRPAAGASALAAVAGVAAARVAAAAQRDALVEAGAGHREVAGDVAARLQRRAVDRYRCLQLREALDGVGREHADAGASRLRADRD